MLDEYPDRTLTQIALGSAIAAYLNLSLNYIFLERRTGAILQAAERKAIVITVFASVVAVGAGLLVEPLFGA